MSVLPFATTPWSNLYFIAAIIYEKYIDLHLGSRQDQGGEAQGPGQAHKGVRQGAPGDARVCRRLQGNPIDRL